MILSAKTISHAAAREEQGFFRVRDEWAGGGLGTSW
jgi:hypothetical protein